MITESTARDALNDLSRACKREGVDWALVGGQALIVYGVPRETLDADALVEPTRLCEVAQTLVEVFDWIPLCYDVSTGDYLPAREVTSHFMDDPVLFDVGQERIMVPLRTSLGLVVELLAAQHPVEEAMVAESEQMSAFGIVVPVAPLGGVLLVKTKADRIKDVAAIEQVAEHLDAATVRGAAAWAEKYDPATAEDLRSILAHVRHRRTPKRTSGYVRKVTR